VNARWTSSARTRFWVTLLLLPALAGRMLVPPGFMPGTAADDAPTMQMCHGAGRLPQGAQSPVGGDGDGSGDPAHHESPCVFAAAGTAAPPPITLTVLYGPAPPDVVPSQPEPTAVHATHHHRAHPPRAPPAIVSPA
jgi:hypothetical protein